MKRDAFDDQLKNTLAAPEKADEAARLIEANKNIALEKSPNSILISYEGRNNRFVDDLRKVYDYIAQNVYGFKTMDHMIAIAHTEIVARCIEDPVKFGPSAIKAIAQIQEKIHPQEKITAKKEVPGSSKHEIIKRLEAEAAHVNSLQAKKTQ